MRLYLVAYLSLHCEHISLISVAASMDFRSLSGRPTIVKKLRSNRSTFRKRTSAQRAQNAEPKLYGQQIHVTTSHLDWDDVSTFCDCLALTLMKVRTRREDSSCLKRQRTGQNNNNAALLHWRDPLSRLSNQWIYFLLLFCCEIMNVMLLSGSSQTLGVYITFCVSSN